jgi:hypothetical protein
MVTAKYKGLERLGHYDARNTFLERWYRTVPLFMTNSDAAFDGRACLESGKLERCSPHTAVLPGKVNGFIF